jgi:hypothetical protein
MFKQIVYNHVAIVEDKVKKTITSTYVVNDSAFGSFHLIVKLQKIRVSQKSIKLK